MSRPPYLLALLAALLSPAAARSTGRGDSDRLATVRGRLVDEAKLPVAGFPLVYSLHAGGQRLHAEEVTTDARGRYELRVPSGPADGAAWVRVAVEAKGYQPRAVFRRTYGGRLQIDDLVLARGWTTHLRVVDAEGTAVGGAGLSLFDREAPTIGASGPLWWRREDGCQVATWDPVARRYDIFASTPTSAFVFMRLERLGSAFARVEFGPEHEGGEVTAVLRNGRELSGRLRDPEGHSLAHVCLVAHPVDWTSSFDPSRTIREIAGGGLCVAKARTDAKGLFRFRALQDGDYTIQVVDEVYSSHQGPSLPRGSWRAGTSDVELRLEAHRLVIEVRDERGEPIRSGEPLCAFAAGTNPQRLRPPSVREAGLGRWTVEVHPGHTYTYGWFAEDRLPVEGTVAIEQGSYMTQRVLELAPRVEPTELRIAVRGERGEELPMAFWSVGIELRSVTTAQVFDEGRSWQRDPVQTLRVPPGRYDLAATPGYGFRFCGDDPTPPIPYGAVVQPVTVPAHGPFDVELRLWEGGRVHLYLELPDDVHDPRLAAFRTDDPCARARSLSDVDASSTTVALDDPSASAEPLLFYLRTDDLSHSGAYEGVVPGTDAISYTLLRPGRHVLRLETPGFLPQSVAVEVERGVTTPVHVRLGH